MRDEEFSLQGMYRRKEDQGLLVLSERVNNLQKTLDEKSSLQKDDLKEIEKKQDAAPCGENSVRITHLEKAMWLAAGAILALVLNILYKSVVG